MTNIYVIRLENKTGVSNFCVSKGTTEEKVNLSSECSDWIVFKKKYEAQIFIEDKLHELLYSQLTIAKLKLDSSKFKLLSVASGFNPQYVVVPRSNPIIK